MQTRNYNKRIVELGGHHIGGREATILEAYLGTCVGVAMYDPGIGIGGLLHVALPDQPADASTDHAFKYASTGVPLILQQLYEKGVSPGNLKASIAGGALMPPLKDRDIRLDLGGRTVEIVKQTLLNEGIEIAQSETGGCGGSKMSLNLENGECVIGFIGKDTDLPQAPTDSPTPRDLHKSIEKLKPIPQVALRILRMIDDPAADLKEIVQEVAKEQVIAARTLRLCNSVACAPRAKIESIHHAIVYLGQRAFSRIVLTACINDLLNTRANSYALVAGGLFRNAVGTAIIAEALTRRLKGAPAPVAYTGGLIHDIGKVVLDHYWNDAASSLYWKTGQVSDLTEVEKDLLGIDHAEAGKLLAQRWELPESLQEVIHRHHDPGAAVHAPVLTLTVYLAALMMSRFFNGLALEALDAEKLSHAPAALGATPAELEQAFAATVIEMSDILPQMLYHL
jgi:putative nucleotidyltransferase with HDIG domain